MKEDNKDNILKRIKYPDELRKLPVEQLPEVCDELRADILKELSVNPGHLASSLGAVEMTVALHYVFNTPYDRLVWDVGHQAYGHKILTGRLDSFCTNRKLGGLRPFPSPEESEYDSFMCGHASNSISAALGMAVAARQTGHDDRHVVAIIGDGAMSGGLAFEGLNNVSTTPNDMIIILNDNNMSIDRSVGGMKQYLLRLNTSETYNKLRYKAAKWLHSNGMLDDERRKGIIRLSNALKSAISHQQNIFEGMNIRYFGPFDGHNVVELVRTLRQLKEMKGPKLLHLHTIKGHGYAPAEKAATIWHAPGKFDLDTGQRIKTEDGTEPAKFQDVFGNTLLELARENKRIVGVTPAMPTGCSLNIMMKEMPERTFDVGIAEGHAVTFSGGMAKDGLQPFCNIYSAFAQRAYDNIIHDVAILNLPVVICLDRAGLVGEDGATHQCNEDIALMRTIPGMIVINPSDDVEAKAAVKAAYEHVGPVYLRFGRLAVPVINDNADYKFEIGKAITLREGTDVTIIATGLEVSESLAAAEKLAADGISAEVINMHTIKPLDEAAVVAAAAKTGKIVTVEEHSVIGGLGSAVCDVVAEKAPAKVMKIGVNDTFGESGPAVELIKKYGLDADSIYAKVKEFVK